MAVSRHSILVDSDAGFLPGATVELFAIDENLDPTGSTLASTGDGNVIDNDDGAYIIDMEGADLDPGVYAIKINGVFQEELKGIYIPTIRNVKRSDLDDATLEWTGTTVRVKADGIGTSQINWGDGTSDSNEVDADDVPYSDENANFSGDNVEDALDETGQHIVDTDNPHGVAAADVGLGDVLNIKHNITSASDPGVNADADDDYSRGSIWVNTTTGHAFICKNPAVGAAQWVKFTDFSNLFDTTSDDVGAIDLTTALQTIYGETNLGDVLELLHTRAGLSGGSATKGQLNVQGYDGLENYNDLLSMIIHNYVNIQGLSAGSFTERILYMDQGSSEAAAGSDAALPEYIINSGESRHIKTIAFHRSQEQSKIWCTLQAYFGGEPETIVTTEQATVLNFNVLDVEDTNETSVDLAHLSSWFDDNNTGEHYFRESLDVSNLSTTRIYQAIIIVENGHTTEPMTVKNIELRIE